MKRKLLSALSALACILPAGAQDMYYAKELGASHYYGTARSVSLGNAMTALGGDPGAVGLNPAGSAVASYSVFTLTPGVVISATSSAYAPNGTLYEDAQSYVKPRMALPNIALGLNFDKTGSFVRRVSFGFYANTVHSFQSYTTASGRNDLTSYAAMLAAASNGIAPGNLGGIRSAGYNANMFGYYNAAAWKYMASNESLSEDGSYHYLTAPIDQRSWHDTYGTHSDILLNLGFQLGSGLYVGANVGFPSYRYRREDSFFESAATDVFPVSFVDEQGGVVTTNYKGSSMEYRLNTDATGIYAKLGFIWLPAAGLRIGAAVQTPAALRISESWRFVAGSDYADRKFNGGFENGDSYDYSLRTPWLLDFGLAYTFGGVALVSVDYEWKDYSVMRYAERTSRGTDYTAFYGVNETNRLFCGASHSLRVGTEIRPLPMLALRAGFSLVTDPEKIWTASDGQTYMADDYLDADGKPLPVILKTYKYKEAATYAWSLGVGYSSPGSFFLDAAVRLACFPQEYFAPYYYGGYEAVDGTGRNCGYVMPMERIGRRLWDVLLTFGWRF